MSNATLALMIAFRLLQLVLEATEEGRDVTDAEMNLALSKSAQAESRWKDLLEDMRSEENGEDKE